MHGLGEMAFTGYLILFKYPSSLYYKDHEDMLIEKSEN